MLNLIQQNVKLPFLRVANSVNINIRRFSEFSIRELYSPEQKLLLQRTTQVIDKLGTALTSLELNSEDKQVLANAADGLNEPFMIMVCGEFNAGKSQFINSLLGAEYCKTGVLPTTSKIVVLQYGNPLQHIDEDEITETIKVPVSLLRETRIVDTPGTNAVHRHHEQITKHFVPRADMVFFLTSIDRPLSSSERNFLQIICEWKKKVAIVINKADLAPDPNDRRQILAHVTEHARQVMQTQDPVIMFTSGVNAFRAKQCLVSSSATSSERDAAKQVLVDLFDQAGL
jgi:ribosome biogenesis GTPase A